MIVEDDLPLSDVLAFTLRRAGYDPLLAHGGLAALDVWRAEQPETALLLPCYLTITILLRASNKIEGDGRAMAWLEAAGSKDGDNGGTRKGDTS